VLTEVIHLYLARELDAVEAAPEEHEVLEVEWLPLPEAASLAVHGQLRDGKSLVGLLWADAALAAEAGAEDRRSGPVP
jgi:ADP-ribose pyrophosphatase